MKNPLVTIIIPCFNAATWVVDAIKSIRAQSYKHVEIILVDDGSSDASVATVKQADPDVVVIESINRGACSARNIGLQAAHGEFIVFLDADDYIEGPFLEELVGLSNGQDLVVSSHTIENEEKQRHPKRSWPDLIDIESLMSEYLLNFLQTAAFLWRRSFVLDNGGWDEALPIAQDTDLAIRLIACRPRFAIVQQPMGSVIWRAVGGDSRITTRMTEKKRVFLRHVLDKNYNLILSLGDKSIKRGLAFRYYSLARLCYACSDRANGDLALKNARQIWVGSMPGGKRDKIATFILGLRLKTLIAATSYRLFSRKPLHQRPHPYNLGA